jgi:hypothetical protein
MKRFGGGLGFLKKECLVVGAGTLFSTGYLSWPENAIRSGISRSLLWVIPLALHILPVSPVLAENTHPFEDPSLRMNSTLELFGLTR